MNGDGFGVYLSGVSASKVDFPAGVGAFGTADFTVAFELTGPFIGGRAGVLGNRTSIPSSYILFQDSWGIASLRLCLFTDAGFVDATVEGHACQQ